MCGADRTCAAGSFYPGVLAVKPCTNIKPWKMEVTVPNEDRCREVKVVRRGLPVVCVKASTLHVLQGTTADPGLLFHWVFPRRLKGPMRWLAIYVALSRVRRLKNLRSIGLNKEIRRIMEAGPLTHCPLISRGSSTQRRHRLPWLLMPLWPLWGGFSGAAEPTVSTSSLAVFMY